MEYGNGIREVKMTFEEIAIGLALLILTGLYLYCLSVVVGRMFKGKGE